MTPRAKRILTEALFIWDNAPAVERPALYTAVVDQLETDRLGKTHIGAGFDADYVTAGNIFSRIKQNEKRHVPL